jgi:hypothetical protein
MALGYAGLILIDNKQYLVTDGTVDHVRPEIASEGTYAARELNTATNKVHVFDLDELSGGVNIDCNTELLDQLFDSDAGWVTHRDEARSFLWYSNQENDIEYGDAFWTRISLSAGAGSFLTSSIDMVMIPGTDPESAPNYPLPTRNLQLGDNYINQKYGFASENGAIVEDDPATPISFSSPAIQQPIPYWKSLILFEDINGDSVLPENVYIQNWSLEINNPVSRRNLCQAVSGTNSHPGPQLIQVGLANLTLNVTFVTVITPESGESRKFEVPESFWNARIRIENDAISRDIQLARMDASTDSFNDFSKPVQQVNDGANISGIGAIQEISFQVQGYFTMPHIV